MTDDAPDPHLEQLGRRLSQQLPSMLRDLHAKKMGKIVTGNGHVPKKLPCQLCGNPHYGGAFKERHKHCPRCRQLLRKGFTIFTTLSTKSTHRYMIVKDPRIKDEHQGAVVVVSDAAMDGLEAKYKMPDVET